MIKLKTIALSFKIPRDIKSIIPFGGGLINQTYKVEIYNIEEEFILQKINHSVFINVDLLQNNIKRISEHIRQKFEEAGEIDLERKILTLIPALDGKLYFYDNVNYWRMTLLIRGSITLQEINEQSAFFAGKAFGKYQSLLADLQGEPLGETIPNFHNIEYRLSTFKQAKNEDVKDRLKGVQEIVAEIEKRSTDMCICENLFREGRLPKRINHCDTKVNNILFDENGTVLCVIDLDTTMPGFVMSDFGDFIRTAGNNGKEDDLDLDNVFLDMDVFKSYTSGYMEEAMKFLTPIEIDLLPFGARLMTYMQLVRFLTDYLNGDIYYLTTYPLHNLQRSKAQLTLLESIESHYDEMTKFISSYICKKN